MIHRFITQLDSKVKKKILQGKVQTFLTVFIAKSVAASLTMPRSVKGVDIMQKHRNQHTHTLLHIYTYYISI